MNNNSANATAQPSKPISYYAAVNPYLFSLMTSINLNMTYIVFFPGIVFNLLTAFVFWRKKFWHHSTVGFYYVTYSTACNLCLMSAVLVFYPSNFGANLNANQTLCQFISFLRFVCTYGYAWLEVQMTVDRAINIVYPRRFRWMTKPRNLGMIVAAIYLIVAAFSSLNFFRSTVQNVTPSLMAGNATSRGPTICTLSNTLQSVYSMFNIIHRSSTFIIVFIANFVLIRRVFNSKKALHKKSKNYLSRKEFSFAFSLMSNNILNFILLLPSLIALILQFYAASAPDSSSDFISFTTSVFNITLAGNYIFAATPFFVNLAFNKLFRGALMKISSNFQPSFMTSTARPE